MSAGVSGSKTGQSKQQEHTLTVRRILEVMFEAEYLIYCAGKSADENGNISLHGIFDVIFAAQFPTHHQPFIIVFNLRATKAIIKKQLTMKLTVELDGKEVNRVEADGEFTVEQGANMTPGINVSQFVFPKPGNYQVKLYVEDRLLITRPLRLRDAAELIEK